MYMEEAMCGTREIQNFHFQIFGVVSRLVKLVNDCEGNELQECKGDEGCADLSPLYQVIHSLLPGVAVKTETTGKTTTL